jgi:hypothetical protein
LVFGTILIDWEVSKYFSIQVPDPVFTDIAKVEDAAASRRPRVKL